MAFFGKLKRKLSKTSSLSRTTTDEVEVVGTKEHSIGTEGTDKETVDTSLSSKDPGNKTEPDRILYMSQSSPNCKVTWLYMIMNDLPCKIIYIDHKKEDLTKTIQNKSPLGILPILEERDLTIHGCQSILSYLSETYTNYAYFGKTPEERAQVDSVICWSQNSLTRSVYHDYAGPQIHEDLSIGEFENLSLVSHGKEELIFHFETLEERYLKGLSRDLKSNKYLLGKNLCMADIYTAELLTPLESVLFDFTPWPYVCQWFEDVKKYINKTVNDGTMRTLSERLTAS